MGKEINKLLLVLGICCMPFFALGQLKSFSTHGNIGISTPILDNGIGFQVGANPSLRLGSILSIEGQVSYIFTKTNASFISGKQGKNNSLNLLGGLRLYLNKEENSIRPYLNLLAGINFAKNELNGFTYDNEVNPGLSTGLFVAFRKVVTGITYDTPQNLNLKVGYLF